MKRRMLALLLALLLLPACALGDTVFDFMLRLKYGALTSYENMVYNYAIDVFERFIMFPDDVLADIWAEIEADHEPDDDEVYDIRYWMSPDQQYVFHVQVKEQSYETFDIEVSKAPEYLTIIADEISKSENTNYVMLHDGLLRDTPEGQMLEIAIAYNAPREGGGYDPVVSIYYDCYYEDIEYIFALQAYGPSYEDAQKLLDALVQTLRITPSGVRL